jgi:Tfp pilus assembly protein PilX
MGMLKSQLHHKINENQSGIASILVTMIMMVVLTLIVLGFATISRREETNSLNIQLSGQAFYAAETGVNDAQQAITQELSSSGTGIIANKSTCGNDPAYSSLDGLNNIDPNLNVSYSCLLINANPTTLNYDPINSTPNSNTLSSATIIPINSGNGTNIQSLKLHWYAPAEDSAKGPALYDSYQADCPSTGSNNLLSASTPGGWTCGYGMLRVEIVPTAVTPTSELDPTDLLNHEMTFYLNPVFSLTPQPATQVQYTACPQQPATSAGSQCGAIIQDQCVDNDVNETGTYCEATITGLNDTNYTLRIQSLYNPSALKITSGNGGSLTGAQALVDSTGDAAGVRKRIQVTFSLTSSATTDVPDEAIEAGGDICKQFLTGSNFYEDKTNSECGTPPTITTPPGQAGVGNCTTDYNPVDCGPNPYWPQAIITYSWYGANKSYVPAGSTVVSCVWNWGDGQTSTDACDPGDFTIHCYPYVATSYTATITELLNNGSSTEAEFTATEPNPPKNNYPRNFYGQAFCALNYPQMTSVFGPPPDP